MAEVGSDPESASRILSEAQGIAEQSADDWSLALLRSGWAYINYKKGDFEKSFIDYLDALNSFEQLEDTVDLYNRLNAIRQLAIINSKFNNYDQSIAYREQSVQLAKEYLDRHPEHAKKLGQESILGDICYYLAVEYQKKGAHQTAGRILADLLKEANAENDVKGHARVLNRLGLIRKSNGEYSEAIKYFKMVATGKEVSQSYKSIAYHNLGETYLIQGELEKAESYLLTALDLKKDIDDPKSKFITYLYLGELAYRRNRMKEAVDLWETGLSHYDKVENDPELYSIYNWLQLAYMDVDIEKAKEFNAKYTQLNNFYVRNQTFLREEEAQRREALSRLIDQERDRRIEAAQRERFVREFWPLFLAVGLIVLFSAILGVRYYLALRAGKLLSKTQLQTERQAA